MSTDCLACALSSGAQELPGGAILASDHWRVEHCVGALGTGTLIVKPLRHCLHVGELSEPESGELGPLLQRVSACVQDLTRAEQVYVCLWSHAGWQPVHIHFVVQPVSSDSRQRFSAPGPTLQSEMFVANEALDVAAVERFCERARSWFAAH